MAKANLKKKLQFWGTGRRKKAIARVRLIPSGSGAIVINDRTLEDYFPMGTLQYIVKQPLAEIAAEGKYDIFVNVIGGGYTGQAGATRVQTCAEKSGLPYARSPRKGKKEVRLEKSTPRSSILQEISRKTRFYGASFILQKISPRAGGKSFFINKLS